MCPLTHPEPAEYHEDTPLQVESELESEHKASQFVDQRIVLARKWQSSLGPYPVHGRKLKTKSFLPYS